jgi:hypothetical protein
MSYKNSGTGNPRLTIAREPGVCVRPWEDIARLAYENHQNKGSVHGHALEDWLEAEAQLRKEAHSWDSGLLVGEAGNQSNKVSRH